MVLNCSYNNLKENTVTIEIAILVGLVVNAALNWWAIKRTEDLEEVVGQMLMDLGKKGVLEVEIIDND